MCGWRVGGGCVEGRVAIVCLGMDRVLVRFGPLQSSVLNGQELLMKIQGTFPLLTHSMLSFAFKFASPDTEDLSHSRISKPARGHWVARQRNDSDAVLRDTLPG